MRDSIFHFFLCVKSTLFNQFVQRNMKFFQTLATCNIFHMHIKVVCCFLSLYCRVSHIVSTKYFISFIVKVK